MEHRKAPTAPVTLNPDVPLGLTRLVNTLLEKDRTLRYQSATDRKARSVPVARSLRWASSG